MKTLAEAGSNWCHDASAFMIAGYRTARYPPEERMIAGFNWFRIPVRWLIALALVSQSWESGLSQDQQPPQVDFNRDVRPLLSDRCFLCHGPDENANTSGIRLDLESAAQDAGIWTAGDPDSSTLMERIESDDPDLVMPPPDSNLGLTAKEKQIFRQWIKQGANYDKHWAFKPLPRSVSVPKIANPDNDLPAGPIDAFVLQQLSNQNLTPSPPAEYWRWLRRVTFDLTGLPPTPEEIEAFQNDHSETAYANVVDRLLDSTAFGERMATPWLDNARYADSYGYQADLLSPTWPYRDWVVRAFNQNLPYDQFVTWQLAGDLVEAPTRESRLATAFNRLHRQTNEGGSVQLEWQTEYCADRVNTFGTAMLGLTLECARCHDHKYDPVSQQDYYNLFAFFNSIDEWGTYLNSSHVPTPSLLLPTEQQQAQLDELQQQLDQVMESLEQRTRQLADEPLPTDTIDAPQPTSFWPIEASNAGNKLDNTIDAQSPATTSAANTIAESAGRTGLKMSGDDGANFPGKTQLAPWQRYTIGLWLYLPESLDDAVILHRQQGTDVGVYGTELTLVDGKLRFAKNRFWPGNALAIETLGTIPDQSWVQITITNDGSGTAAGMQIYVDGQAATKIVRDDLTKDPGVGGSGFTVGERFRAPGLKDAIIDDVIFFDRDLSSLEILTLLGAQNSASNDDRRQHQQLHDQQWQRLSNRRSELAAEILKTRAGFIETMVMEELPQPRPAHVLHRGEYDAPRTEENLAIRAVPDFLHPLAPELPRNRLGLARWATSDQHPLTARVAVNQVWQILFGNGLVGTPEDFGLQGSLPSHPRLLDWLARDFVDSGWDYKRLCKQIVLSRTYRQSSRATLEDRNRDPDNRWLARGPARRLSAEMIRDLALSASGLLNDQLGGPPVSPYQPEKLWRENNTMTPAYQQSVGKSLYRRSLYSVWKRTTPLPNMISFDAPTREVCTVARTETNTPTQSLVLLNDVQFVEASRALAETAIKHADDLSDQIQWMFLQLAGRQADAAELLVLAQLFDQQKTMFSDGRQDAAKLLEVGEAAVDSTLPSNDLAAMTIVAQAIFNCDATVWKR